MFTNLIESDLHVKEFKRRSSFFLVTVAAYSVILFAAGIVSVYAYDAQLEAQTSTLELVNWVPPVERDTPRPVREIRSPVRRPQTTNAPIDPTVRQAERTNFVSRPDDPTKVPDQIGVTASKVPIFTEGARLSNRNVDPPPFVTNTTGSCVTCPAAETTVKLDEKPPEPPPVKDVPRKVPSTVLTSKAVNLPQPLYPPIAKQIKAQGPVNVQILVDEQGKVVSAQVLNGHPTLLAAAKEAAMRARFTPTVLNGQPVKIQGVITYNFVLR